MISKRRVSLQNVQLDELDDRIIVQGIEATAGKDTINTVSQWGADGSRVTGRHRDSLDVNIRFSIRIKPNQFEERSVVFEKVATWAMGGGWLRTNTKPDRRIRVICAQLPAEGDALAWTNEYSITMRAYGVPYWQSETETSARIQDVDTTSLNLGIPGNVATVMNVDFYNNSGDTINDFQIKAGDRKIVLANLGLDYKETLHIDHNDNGNRSVLRIRIENTAGSYRSVLSKRTAASHDDLYVDPGIVKMQMTAGGEGTLVLSCNARYA